MKYLLLVILTLSNYALCLVIVSGSSAATSSARSSAQSSAKSFLASSSASSALSVEDTMDIALSWTPPTKREDGTDLCEMRLQDDLSWKMECDIAGYEIRYKRKDEAEFKRSKIAGPLARNDKLKGLPVTAHDLEIAVFTNSGLYSKFVSLLVDPPNSVTKLKAKAEVIKPTLKVGD